MGRPQGDGPTGEGRLMALTNLDKAPFPWFGGKANAAPMVWRLLGDVHHYVEPFFGGGAVLLKRPHPCNRPYFSETVNDADGLLVNFWRSVQLYPVETAQAASWPVSELDKTARQIACLRWLNGGMRDRLAGDAMFCDPIIAGWWAWGVSCQIGAIRGSWTADPVTGEITKIGSGGGGARHSIPHLTNNGSGVNHPDAREPGASRGIPQMTNNGRGVNNATTREPGVACSIPSVGNDGRGVNNPTAREPGVLRDLPHVSDDGRGVNTHTAREPGVLDPPSRPAFDDIDWGRGFHDLVMPEVVRWFRYLCARLRHVRILSGDWSRLCTNGAMKTLSVRQGGICGVFLDPPYDQSERWHNLYAEDSLGLSDEVREWCLRNGDDPKLRIVLAGFDTEHTELEKAGWTVHEWYKDGYLTGGMGNISRGSQMHRDRLWASPGCLRGDHKAQISLLDHIDE